MAKTTIKISKKMLRNVKIFLVVVVAIISITIAYKVSIDFYNSNIKEIKMWNYRGNDIGFRADLRKADKVPVYPGETEVYLDTMHPLVKNITIAYKDVEDSERGYYAVEAYEITYKMKIAYSYLVGTDSEGVSKIPTFNVEVVDQYAHLPGKIQNPIIALVHPVYANETSVRNEGHVTYISGETFEEFDLATVKFLMTIMGIEL